MGTPSNGHMGKTSLFGIQIDALTCDQAMRQILTWIKEADGTCRYVVTPNLDHAVLLRDDDFLLRAYESAALVLADGMPLVWASRLLGRRLPERVAGSDLTPALLDASCEVPMRVFLLGALPERATQAAHNIEALYPAVTVVGTCSPEPGFERDADTGDAIVEKINAAYADLLIVGLGAPKQEIWVARHYQRLRCPVALCVGATIDFLAQPALRAPPWMQRFGLEWLHRATRDPRRLFPRYARDAVHLPGLLWREFRRH